MDGMVGQKRILCYQKLFPLLDESCGFLYEDLMTRFRLLLHSFRVGRS